MKSRTCFSAGDNTPEGGCVVQSTSSRIAPLSGPSPPICGDYRCSNQTGSIVTRRLNGDPSMT